VNKLRECIDCDWCQSIKNSDGNYIYICVNTDSGAYLEETGICGNCDTDEE
jgi:hypothetical protein